MPEKQQFHMKKTAKSRLAVFPVFRYDEEKKSTILFHKKVEKGEIT